MFRMQFALPRKLIKTVTKVLLIQALKKKSLTQKVDFSIFHNNCRVKSCYKTLDGIVKKKYLFC